MLLAPGSSGEAVRQLQIRVAGSRSLCQLAQEARNHGFAGILGPGYPDHNDHTHVDGRPSRFWSAPDCGVASLDGSLDPLGDD